MNIRDWPLGSIMQLPDCCFGRRYIVAAEQVSAGLVTTFDISELALPDRAVFWSVSLYGGNTDAVARYCRLALGDQLPAAAAEMDVLEPLLPGLGVQGPEPRNIGIVPGIMLMRLTMKQYVSAQGRRIVVSVTSGLGKETFIRCSAEISSIPTEVPDCLLSV